MAPLDLDTLLREQQPIFVANQTKPKGILVINFPDGTYNVPVTLPKTGHPFNLSARVPADFLGRSLELRRFLSRGLVTLVNPKSALKLLEDPEVAEELKEAEERTYTHGRSSVKEEPEAIKKSKEVENAFKTLMSRNDDSVVEASADEEEEVPLNLRAKVTVQRFLDKDLKVSEALSDLKAISTELSPADFQYIQSQVPTGRIGKWVRSKVEKLNTPEEEESS